MRRNLIAIALGAVLSFLLHLWGSRLAWRLMLGNVAHTDDKDAWVGYALFVTFVVVPGVSIITGAFVGLVVQRSLWWLGGIAVLPLFVYGFIRGAAGTELVLSIIDTALAFAAAFGVSRFKRPVLS
jgi:hypothetical protein